ncbi:hypothetical protein H8E88_16340 [candidate division KSB1 bacterium]|nr:hypothetical protein [candidate division KSB1 bacterium]
MYDKNECSLRPAEKVNILWKLFKDEKVGDLVDSFDTRGVIGLQNFLWETAAEFGVICRGKNFSSNEITRKMTSTSKYQEKQGCTERAYYCKGTQCILSNPECARKKIKEQVNIIAESMQEYIRIERNKENF